MSESEQSTSNPRPRETLPSHVAIVMDGNGRWAKQRTLPRLMGHKRGADAVRTVVRCAGELGIKNLTLFAFSSENWNRPREEVSGLMSLFMTSLTNEIGALHKAGVRIRMIGDLTRFSDALQGKIREAQDLTARNSDLTLNICVNYGGRWDIVEACRNIVADGVPTSEIDEKLFARYVQIPDSGDVDLLIRTSGESRISNFLLWQIAYSELYFTSTLWPEFGREEFIKALDWYAGRERRFGKTSEQIKACGEEAKE